MDWWRIDWPFSSVRKIFFRGRIERAIFVKFQAPKFENSEPEKLQFHTPSHSIPPLDSLPPNKKGPKKPQKCTIADDCRRVAESGLKPPFGLAPIWTCPFFLQDFWLRSRDVAPRGPNDQKNLISIEIFNLDRNF